MVKDSGCKQVSYISKSYMSSKGGFHIIYEAYTYKLDKFGSCFSLLLCTNAEVNMLVIRKLNEIFPTELNTFEFY